jgi:hypothetical protein
MNETAVLKGPILRTSNNSKPILVKISGASDEGISHIHLPGESEYEKVLSSINEIASRLKMSFEDSAKYLGYELGFAVEHFSV